MSSSMPTHRRAFGRFTRMLVCPETYLPTYLSTHDVPFRDTTSNAQCALRDSLGVSGRGSSPPRAAISRGAPRMFTHAERTIRVHGLGEGSREGWSFASPGWRLCRKGKSIVDHNVRAGGEGK